MSEEGLKPGFSVNGKKNSKKEERQAGLNFALSERFSKRKYRISSQTRRSISFERERFFKLWASSSLKRTPF